MYLRINPDPTEISLKKLLEEEIEVVAKEEDWDVDNVWYVLAWRLHLITKKPSKGKTSDEENSCEQAGKMKMKSPATVPKLFPT